MRFYDALQMDPAILKRKMIHNRGDVFMEDKIIQFFAIAHV